MLQSPIEPFYKCDAFNFVPLTRTPWAGSQISNLKRKYFTNAQEHIPTKIGEAWEVSTDAQFPSCVVVGHDKKTLLSEFIAQHSLLIVGQENFHKYGAHFPILLKWLEANQLLSVQLHPTNINSFLKNNECGKPEAWLVLNVQEGGFVYLGFQQGLSRDKILTHLKKDEPEKCLYKYFPKKYDYISVPPGCVHAVGPGVLVVEPQYVLPQKIAKTWRLSDWKRLYNEHGQLSEMGKPRELHIEEALPSINWDLPQGEALVQTLVQQISPQQPFYGDKNNPFALAVFTKSGLYHPLVAESLSLFTVWSGRITLKSAHHTLSLQGGESGFICASAGPIEVLCEEGEPPNIAFFALGE